MGGLFSKPKAPAQPAPQPIPAPVPTRSAAEVEAEAVAERTRRAMAGGRASTLLTGTTDTATPSAAKTLLGAG